MYNLAALLTPEGGFRGEKGYTASFCGIASLVWVYLKVNYLSVNHVLSS
jgi:hypothetical protein